MFFLVLFLVVYLPIRPTIVQWDVGLGILSDTQVTSPLLAITLLLGAGW